MKYTSMMCVILLCACASRAQQPARGLKKPFEAQSSSSVRYYQEGPLDVVDTTNVAYEVVGEQLMLRERVHTKRVIGDIGIEATTTIDAWPLGVDPKEKPLYSITVDGVDPRVVNGDLLVISRGLEEIDWWSVYNVGNGQHLLDTYVPLVQFSISRDTQALRYVGLEVPPDDSKDARLKAPAVVAVLTYASAERVLQEVLITCDDPKSARLFRSFDDSTRTVVFSGDGITLSISQNYPSPLKTVAITVPISRDGLDIAHSQAPAGLHVTAWKR